MSIRADRLSGFQARAADSTSSWLAASRGNCAVGASSVDCPANLDVTTKAVERTSEAIGADIAAHEQEQIKGAMQLNLPIVIGQPIPILYVQMDGTGIP